MTDDADLVRLETTVIPDTLPALGSGDHRPGSMTPCAMEAASWLAGEAWSAKPRSVHPAIAAVARAVNDAVSDADRQELWPLILASLGTGQRRGPILRRRLGRVAKRLLHAREPVSRATWEAMLDRYARLTKTEPRVVDRSRQHVLEELMRVPFAESRR